VGGNGSGSARFYPCILILISIIISMILLWWILGSFLQKKGCEQVEVGGGDGNDGGSVLWWKRW